MRWPWVSRATHEAELRILTQSFEHAMANVREANARYDVLSERYHALRVSGANAVPVGMEAAPVPTLASDLAIEDVVSKYGNNPRLRRVLQRFQAEQRRQNTDEGKIADRITNWRDPDEDQENAA